ncbi:MAG: cytochrome c3 family protein [Candidatus Binatia bacterium]
MKKIGILILSVVALIALGSSAYAAGIADTRHNLVPTALGGTGNGDVKGQFGEICVYCHTPHGGDTIAPLWNRQDSSPGSYSLYNSRTFDATFATGAPTGVSKACLSCHDGTLSVNALRNYPGSGAAITGSMVDTRLSNVTLLNDMAEIGTDLRDDHPISMKYESAKSPGTGGSIGDNTHAAGFTDSTQVTTGKFAVVKGSITLPLYPYNTTKSEAVVQCASCHDPHQNTANTTAGSESVDFLRVANTGSQLCLTCHLK